MLNLAMSYRKIGEPQTILANEVKLMWDGNRIMALIGPDLQGGAGGFGRTVEEALRDLADNLVKWNVTVEVEEPDY
jgi:hypothetical protein